MKRRTTKFNYFDAFASQAELAAKEAELLMLVVENFDRAEKLQEYLPEAHRIENEADEVHHSIHDALLPDFVPPLDREDITSICMMCVSCIPMRSNSRRSCINPASHCAVL